MSQVGVSRLRDYTADSRLLYVSGLASALGAVAAVAAWCLLMLIALATNLFYFHQWSFLERDPWEANLRWWSVFIPVVGGLIVGMIARFLSPRVRGHGMPEAVETIVFGGGRVQPRVAVLKPIATAIAIGSGGPFGAEGPVIVTGGAIGSVLGQLLTMSDSERTVLMVAGASAGMAATFNCPMAAILLAVEILLFEWKPRSVVPVAMACVTAGAVRRLLLGPAALFVMKPQTQPVYHQQMLGALIIGVAAAFFSLLLSKAIRLSEKMFHKLPFHWMWWPAIGGLGVGIGGLFFPRALGVGYSTLQLMILNGRHTEVKILVGILVVKSLIWVFALGSETAGGILAPLLLLGGAMGAMLGRAMPQMTAGSWVVVGMTSTLTGAIGCPLTSAMLALELTRNAGIMLPVLLACMASYGVSVLVQRRSMLTEALSAKGLHLSREFSVDPLETMLVSQAMHTSVFALNSDARVEEAKVWLRSMEERGAISWSHWQRIFPLVDAEGKLTGMLTRGRMVAAAQNGDSESPLADFAVADARTISPFHTLKAAAASMATYQLTSYPVVASDGKLLGVLTIEDLLKGRTQQDQRENSRRRVLRLRWPFGAAPQTVADAVTEVPPNMSPTRDEDETASH
ncbi:chloride channel protein [Granulicella cerasi]|uniref:Chloride channel protein n=1 Tax=Granulicella cerasi TaxID=741063 RepID=A0ABW1ZCN3_9BACT|nr:chloride channel protein [Granulicella cerasi]